MVRYFPDFPIKLWLFDSFMQVLVCLTASCMVGHLLTFWWKLTLQEKIFACRPTIWQHPTDCGGKPSRHPHLCCAIYSCVFLSWCSHWSCTKQENRLLSKSRSRFASPIFFSKRMWLCPLALFFGFSFSSISKKFAGLCSSKNTELDEHWIFLLDLLL